MRVDLKKYLFAGLLKEREAFFKSAQEIGVVHFIDPKGLKSQVVPEDVQHLNGAIKVLRGLPPVEQEETDEYAIADGLANKILQLRDCLEKLAVDERTTRLEMGRVEPFGNFSMEDIAWIEKEGKRKIQFYAAKLGFADSAQLPENAIYLKSEHALDYFITINDTPSQYDRMIEMLIEHPYKELKARYAKILSDKHETEAKLMGYAKYNHFLHHALVNKLNQYNLTKAEGFIQEAMDDKLFAVEGWAPVNKAEELADITRRLHVYSEEIAVEESDSIPTCLQNEGLSRVGEDLVHIYDTPSPTDDDPSPWVLFFFALFFAMILGDAGYGFALMLTVLFIRYKAKKVTSFGRRFLTLCMILCLFTIVWGILMTSFFGIEIGPDNPLRKVSLMTWLVDKKAEYIIAHQDETWKHWVAKYPELEYVKNPHEFVKLAHKEHGGRVVYEMYNKFADNIMMEFALMIGVIHIIISFLRYIGRNLTGIGWILFLIGGYLYFPTFLGATSIIHFVIGVDPQQGGADGLYLIYGGIALAVIFGIWKNKLLGILEASTVIQIFADVLSYLRLYALGLSGSLFTATMMDLAVNLNYVLAAAVLIPAHIVNIGLGIMGGVIHGLRLNFLEWYHWSFEGGGKVYNPLRKIKIE